MKKTIYLVRHSGPFVDLKYDHKLTFEEQSNNMILSVEAEEKAKKISKMDELQNIDAIYSSNSSRAIATAKYIAYENHLAINIDNNFNERKFGIKYIEELPYNFIIKQFQDECYKLEYGESLLDVKKRIELGLNKIFNNDKQQKVVIVLHGIALMALIKLYCNVVYDEKTFKITKDSKIIYDDMIKAPDIFKLEFENDKLIKCENIKI